MSADNIIVILGTFKDRTFKERVYRVAHICAIDNLYYYQENEYYNLGWYLHSEFGDCIVYDNLEKATEVAFLEYDMCSYVEYGVTTINLDIIFPGD